VRRWPRDPDLTTDYARGYLAGWTDAIAAALALNKDHAP